MMSDNDFLFSDKLQPTTFNGYNVNTEVMPIVLNEFQPANAFYMTKLFADLVNSKTSGKLNVDNLFV